MTRTALVQVALVFAATACPTKFPSGPDLVSGEWIDNQTLRLSFSEPIADVSEVDPLKFRISSGGYCKIGGACDPKPGTWYVDLGAYQDPQQYTTVTSLQNDPDDGYAIILGLDGTIDSACIKMEEWAQNPDYSDIAFYPTYAPGNLPVVQNAEGGWLAQIAPQWVQSEANGMVVDGYFENMDPMVGIPCP